MRFRKISVLHHLCRVVPEEGSYLSLAGDETCEGFNKLNLTCPVSLIVNVFSSPCFMSEIIDGMFVVHVFQVELCIELCDHHLEAARSMLDELTLKEGVC
jgi:hypothetical protein